MKSSDIASAVTGVTKKWATQRKREERSSRARFRRSEYMYSDRVNQTDAAWEAIPAAYAKASDNGRLPAHARQIFYAARSAIQEATGRTLESQYFTQTLLPKFMNQNQELTDDWWVVYDARGHLTEPHTELVLRLGTLEVEEYLRKARTHTVDDVTIEAITTSYPTKGTTNRVSAILFIEKEGFNPLFKEVKLAERYDLAIMSTKGQSVTAARRLVDELCADHDGVPVLVLHDFDQYGFKIAETLTEVSWRAEQAGRVRYAFENEINVIDLGLRLDDVEEWSLDSEAVKFKGVFDHDTIATPEEQAFLRSDRRVELNAFTSADFVRWIEAKLDEHGIQKVIPNRDTLRAAYGRAYQTRFLNRKLDEIREEATEAAEGAPVPRDLAKRIKEELELNPERSWDLVVAEYAEERLSDDL